MLELRSEPRQERLSTGHAKHPSFVPPFLGHVAGKLRVVHDSWAAWKAKRVAKRFLRAAPQLEALGIIPSYEGLQDNPQVKLPSQKQDAADTDEPSPSLADDLVTPTDWQRTPPLDFLVGAPFHIARGMVTTIFGSGGVGKTSFAMDLVAHFVLGRPFLDAEMKPGRVFYAELEGAGNLLARTRLKVEQALEEVHPGAKEILRKNFHQRHYTPHEKARWDYATGMVPALIKQLGRKYDVVVIDSYEAATMGDSNDPQQTAKAMLLFSRLAAETNTAVVLIDHSPKGNSKTVYGSTKKTDFARVVINLEAASDGSDGMLSITSVKCNVAPKPVFPPVERCETDTTLRFGEATTLRVNLGGAADDGRVEHLAHLIAEAKAHGAKNKEVIYEHIQTVEGLGSSDAARKRIKRAGLDHLLPESQRGRRTRA